MIWDMPTVHAIEGYYVEAAVDISIIDRPGARDTIGHRLFRELEGIIKQAWPVAIDEEDCVMGKTGESAHFMTETYRMVWRPQGRPGEIMGGKHDGITTQPITTITDLIAPLYMPNDDPSIASLYAGDPITGEHPIITHTNRYTQYEITGWSDLHRRWIYTPKER